MTSARSKLYWTVLVFGVILLTGYAATAGTLEAYGELLHHNESGEDFTTGPAGYYNLTLLANGSMGAFTSGGHTLIVPVGGVYKINWALAFGGTGAASSEEYEITVLVNGTEREHCEAYRKLGANGDVGSASGTCIERLTAQDITTLGIECPTCGAPVAIQVYIANMNLMKVGD